MVRLLALMSPLPSLDPCLLFGEKGQNWVAITRCASLVLYNSQKCFYVTISCDLHYDLVRKGSSSPFIFAVPNLQTWKMSLKGDSVPCPKPHSREVILAEREPRTSHTRVHLVPMTLLCLAKHKGPFLLSQSDDTDVHQMLYL